MILKNILSKLYPKVYVGIVSSSSDTVVCIELFKKNKLIDSQTQVFRGNEVTQKIIDFISMFNKESPFFYISLLDDSVTQGVLFECDAKAQDSTDEISTISKVCHGSWSSYSLNSTLLQIQQKYATIGVDFIFSPFTVLSNIFSDKKQENKVMLFVLLQEDLVVLSIFHKDKPLYAKVVSMHDTIEDEEINNTIKQDEDTLLEENQETIDLDDLDLDDLDLDDLNLDDLSDLQDSESFDDLEDFAQIQEDEVVQPQKHDISTSSKDYKRFLIVQNALHNFYSSSKYSSEFVEVAYVASFCQLEKDFKQYLEDELFLTAYIRSVKLCMEVISLAKEEPV